MPDHTLMSSRITYHVNLCLASSFIHASNRHDVCGSGRICRKEYEAWRSHDAIDLRMSSSPELRITMVNELKPAYLARRDDSQASLQPC